MSRSQIYTDGGSSYKLATFTGNLYPGGLVSAGHTLDLTEKSNWFVFRTIGKAFKSSFLNFAGAFNLGQGKFDVFFKANYQSKGKGTRVASFQANANAKTVGIETESPGYYYVRVSRLSDGNLPYGFGCNVVAQSKSQFVSDGLSRLPSLKTT
ncbi:MAG: hypothetical protein IGR76_15495 [Synechococcales cyanobacterium T60_A2020_003]|nr:hypothetical protein [Synechococcales cyanobacterium T60_A2020_003]